MGMVHLRFVTVFAVCLTRGCFDCDCRGCEGCACGELADIAERAHEEAWPEYEEMMILATAYARSRPEVAARTGTISELSNFMHAYSTTTARSGDAVRSLELRIRGDRDSVFVTVYLKQTPNGWVAIGLRLYGEPPLDVGDVPDFSSPPAPPGEGGGGGGGFDWD